MVEKTQWAGFKGRLWKEEINVRDFIQNNYTPYDGDESFLAGPTEATNKLWGKLQELQKEERAKGGVLDKETKVVTGLTASGPGYIDESMKDLEQVVGLQTDKPLKRAFMPYGGIKMAEESCENYGYTPDPELHKVFTEYHKTHNQGVFDAYTPEMRKARHSHIITGLPDTYGRGRIVGDYRRVALYGIDFLIEQKVNDETWLTGEEAAELFDIKVEEANDAVACAGSSMFFCYKNVPTSLTAQGKNAKKKDEQRPLSRQDIKEIFNESFSEYQAREKEKKELLESLNQYGERKQNG